MSMRQVAEMLLTQPPLSKQAWLQYIGKQLYDVCYKHLRVAPKNRRVVLCEDLLFPRNFREALVDAVVNVLKAKHVRLLPAMTTALYATCHRTALIVDAGWHETRILPVFERHPLLHAYTTTSVGSRACCAAISNELPLVRSAEDVLERACFVATPSSSDVVAKPANFYAFTRHAFTVPASTRSHVVESLFQGNEHVSIPDAIQECVAKCPVDTRRALLANIVCIGGTSMLPGFVARLASELAPSHGRIASTLFPPHFMTWIGASIYGSTNTALVDPPTSPSSSTDDWMNIAVA
ncbi:hypothetical protein, variant [Aphanomyces astaci]|uniref:Uncharacterized protein n=1 Tax=Aphanomyces astaci TaxID=112090 RepID=W4GWQ4_APHAT|nr:hypothetical protein, variant [Aphanomyces astaci]ETV84092.1 hypothetical protein, variant [Aphanomyces astaci]|eukprot:XP_009825784.1 hypothetical protein, variant [Aphanomyces astaci]